MTANSAGSIREERAVAMVFAGEGAGEGLYAVRIPEEIDVRAISSGSAVSGSTIDPLYGQKFRASAR